MPARGKICHLMLVASTATLLAYCGNPKGGGDWISDLDTHSSEKKIDLMDVDDLSPAELKEYVTNLQSHYAEKKTAHKKLSYTNEALCEEVHNLRQRCPASYTISSDYQKTLTTTCSQSSIKTHNIKVHTHTTLSWKILINDQYESSVFSGEGDITFKDTRTSSTAFPAQFKDVTSLKLIPAKGSMPANIGARMQFHLSINNHMLFSPQDSPSQTSEHIEIDTQNMQATSQGTACQIQFTEVMAKVHSAVDEKMKQPTS